jgi:hypothetical protein
VQAEDNNGDLKVLFIGPYRQPDSWGSFSRSIISSLQSIEGISLTTRPIFLSNSPQMASQVGPNIFKCESNKQDNYDILIQHALPNFMVGSEQFSMNIGVTSFETKGNVQWNNHLGLLDKILVATESEKKCIPQRFQSNAHAIGGVIENVNPDPQELANRFSFYVLGGSLETKVGLLPILQAYLSEFHINENVSLIIHTTNVTIAQELISNTAGSLGIYSKQYYPHIHIVAENPDDSLHRGCQCLIDMGITRGFREEVAKALLYGKAPIILEGTGMDEYIDSSNGWVVKSSESLLVCPDRPLPTIFTARESCLTPDKFSLKECMRNAFDNHYLYTKKSSKGRGSSSLFSTEKQRNVIKDILCL